MFTSIKFDFNIRDRINKINEIASIYHYRINSWLLSLYSAIWSLSSYVGTWIEDQMHTGAHNESMQRCILFNEFTADSSYCWIDIIGYSFASFRFAPNTPDDKNICVRSYFLLFF